MDRNEVSKVTVQQTVPAAFTASESFDVVAALGSPVSLVYFARAPFKLDGKLARVIIELK